MENEIEEKVKLDFSSEKGFLLCKNILASIEMLFLNYCGDHNKNDRSYREKFSIAYKNLYLENEGQNQICYIQ